MLLQLVGKRYLLKLLNTKKEKERRGIRRTLLPSENLLWELKPHSGTDSILYARCDQSYGKPLKTGGDKSRKRRYEKGRGGGRRRKKEREKEGVQQESRYKKEEEVQKEEVVQKETGGGTKRRERYKNKTGGGTERMSKRYKTKREAEGRERMRMS